MKKINSMDYLLVFGSIILFFSGIALMFNEYFSTYLIKTIGIISLGIILYVLSFIFKYVLHVDKSFKIANLLGSLAIIIAYVMAGWNELMGTWFSINGEGVQLFLASIAFLVMLLSILTSVLFKSYHYVNITFISILVGIFHLLTFFRLDYQISLIIVGLLVLICNLFKFNKYVYNYSIVAVFVYALLTVIFGFEHDLLLSSIILGINSICLLSVLSKVKSSWMEFLVTTSFIILISIFFESFALSFGLVTVIITLIVCVFELAANTFKLIRNNAINTISRLICFFIVIGLAYTDEISLVSQVVVFTFLCVTSVANAYIIKHDSVEKYLLPIKLVFIVGGIFDIITSHIISLNEVYLYATFSFILVIIYKILEKKQRSEKIVYLIIDILSIICMIGTDGTGIFLYIISTLVVLINYLFIRNNNNVVLHRVFYTFILVVLMCTIDYSLGIVTSVIHIALLSILAFLNYKDKYCYLVTAFMIYFNLLEVVDLVIINGVLADIISSIFFLTLVGISSEVMFDNATHKNVFTGILVTLDLLSLFEENYVFIVNLYSLIVSLILILISLKNDNYKALNYIGLIMGALNLVCLISFLDGLPAAIYLLIIAVVLIIIVSIMVYRYQHREIKEEKREVLEVVHYCGECGKKVQPNEKFCGNCGNKIK